MAFRLKNHGLSGCFYCTQRQSTAYQLVIQDIMTAHVFLRYFRPELSLPEITHV